MNYPKFTERYVSITETAETRKCGKKQDISTKVYENLFDIY